jgi:hypothetical protein
VQIKLVFRGVPRPGVLRFEGRTVGVIVAVERTRNRWEAWVECRIPDIPDVCRAALGDPDIV